MNNLQSIALISLINNVVLGDMADANLTDIQYAFLVAYRNVHRTIEKYSSPEAIRAMDPDQLFENSIHLRMKFNIDFHRNFLKSFKAFKLLKQEFAPYATGLKLNYNDIPKIRSMIERFETLYYTLSKLPVQADYISLTQSIEIMP